MNISMVGQRRSARMLPGLLAVCGVVGVMTLNAGCAAVTPIAVAKTAAMARAAASDFAPPAWVRGTWTDLDGNTFTLTETDLVQKVGSQTTSETSFKQLCFDLGATVAEEAGELKYKATIAMLVAGKPATLAFEFEKSSNGSILMTTVDGLSGKGTFPAQYYYPTRTRLVTPERLVALAIKPPSWAIGTWSDASGNGYTISANDVVQRVKSGDVTVESSFRKLAFQADAGVRQESTDSKYKATFEVTEGDKPAALQLEFTRGAGNTVTVTAADGINGQAGFPKQLGMATTITLTKK